ncbi:MAG: glycoside hydrolase family 2 TIM barrel-domain containing protein [Chthoniobacterales bacterium]
MNSYPLHPDRPTHILDGIWDFAWKGETAAPEKLKPASFNFTERMPVPSAFDAYPKYAGKRGTAAYRTFIETTPGLPGRLYLEGTGLWIKVFVDEKAIGEAALPYCPLQFDIPASSAKKRELVVVVDNRFDFKRTPLFEPYFDFYAYGGLYRSVIWEERQTGPSLERTQIFTTDLKRRKIRCRLLFNPAPKRGSIPIDLTLDEKNPLASVVAMVNSKGEAEFELNLPARVNPWSPESPELHTLHVKTPHGEVIERFGLRTVEAKKGQVILNGAPVRLWGYCRHDAHPQFGPGLPLQNLVQDIQLMQSVGSNFVRGAHYPQDPRFLDLCDEMGLMVFEEGLGWQNAHHSKDKKFFALQEDQMRRMIQRSINHPSVICFGFLNEGVSDSKEARPLYKRLAQVIREEDPSRLVTYASARPFKDINYDIADLISINTYPAWYTQDYNNPHPLSEIKEHLKKIEKHLSTQKLKNKPVLISEIGAGALYGWKDPHNGFWTEEYQADYLREACSAIRDNSRFCGVALWQFCDGRTYVGSRTIGRPRAFNNKGSWDEFRRPKQGVKAVREVFASAKQRK